MLNIKIKNFKRNPFTDDKIKKFFDIHSKIVSPEVNIKLNPSTTFTLNLKEENSEFTPVSLKKESIFKQGYSFNFKQFWGYNIASKFSYIYQKEYFKQINNFNFSEKKYSFNITKFFNKNNKFDFLYQYIDTDVGGDNENIYMLQDEKSQKFSFSYEVSFDKKFSLVLLYSLEQNVKEDERAQNNYLYTGFRYIFDLNQK